MSYSSEMLRKLLATRLDCFVPLETHSILCPRNQLRLRDNSEIKIKAPLIKNEDREVVFDYMVPTFYSQAPIPKTLQLSRNCSLTRKYLREELDMFLNGGISFSLLDSKSNILKGVALLAPWKRDEGYDIIDCSTKDWHNAAAEIAHEKSESVRHLIWRNLQFQHIYNLGQQVLTTSRKPFVIYIAIYYLDKDMRSADISLRTLTDYFQAEECRNCSLIVQINIKATEKIAYQVMRNPILIDEVNYADEKLILNENEGRAFKAIDHLGSLRFFAQY